MKNRRLTVMAKEKQQKVRKIKHLNRFFDVFRDFVSLIFGSILKINQLKEEKKLSSQLCLPASSSFAFLFCLALKISHFSHFETVI